MGTHEFRFSDEQWRAYQATPDQGYSHRHHLENLFNGWLAEHDREVAERAWNDALWWAAPTDPVARRWQREKPFPATSMPQYTTPRRSDDHG